MTEVMLGAGVALFGGELEPLHSFEHVIGRHAVSVGVHETEVMLGAGVALFGGEPEPAHRFTVVLRNALAPVMPGNEDLLRVGTALLGLAPDFRNRVLPEHPKSDERQSQHGDGHRVVSMLVGRRSISTSVPHTRQGHPGPASIPETASLEPAPPAGW